MSREQGASKLQALLVLLSALRAGRAAERRGRPERATAPLVKVTSDYGVAPIFPGLR